MLIKTISFDIHDFNANTTESFLILDTIENQEFVFTHRYTRNIQFGKTFDIQLENDMRMPVEMISDSVWLALLPEMEKEMENSEMEIESDDNDIAFDAQRCDCEYFMCEHSQNGGRCTNVANPNRGIGICDECHIMYAENM